MIVKMRLVILAGAIYAIVALVSGCSTRAPSPDLTDRSPFTGIPCEAPCWQGLVIGKSTERDVMSTLPRLSFIDRNAIHVHRSMSMPGVDPSVWSQGAEITVSCIQPPTPCLTLRVVDDVLAETELILNYEISLSEAIKHLGNPDYVGYRMMGAEVVTCEIDVVWMDRQLVLASEEFKGSQIYQNCFAVRRSGPAPTSLLISKVTYMSEESARFLLSTGAGVFFEFSGMAPAK